MSKINIGDAVEVKTFRGRVFDIDDGGMLCIRVRDDLYVWAKEEMVDKIAEDEEDV